MAQALKLWNVSWGVADVASHLLDTTLGKAGLREESRQTDRSILSLRVRLIPVAGWCNVLRQYVSRVAGQGIRYS